MRRKMLFLISLVFSFACMGVAFAFSANNVTAHAAAPRADILNVKYDVEGNSLTDVGDYGFTVRKTKGGSVVNATFNHNGLVYTGPAFDKNGTAVATINQHYAVNWMENGSWTDEFKNKFTDGFSISLAVQLHEITRSDGVVIGNAASGGIQISLEPNGSGHSFEFTIHDGSGYKSVMSPNAVLEDELYHLTGTYDFENSEIRFYINGELVGKTAVGGFRHSTKIGMGVCGILGTSNSADTVAEIAYTAYRADKGYYADTRIYSESMDDSQAKDAYEQFVSGLTVNPEEADVAALAVNGNTIENSVQNGATLAVNGVTAKNTNVIYNEKTYSVTGAGVGNGGTVALNNAYQLSDYTFSAHIAVEELPGSEAVLARLGAAQLKLGVGGELTFSQGSAELELATLSAGELGTVAVVYGDGVLTSYYNGIRTDSSACDGEQITTIELGGTEEFILFGASVYSKAVSEPVVLAVHRSFIGKQTEIVNPAVTALISKIDGIGSVTEDSGVLLSSIASNYSQLNVYQKGQVSNYGVYEQAAFEYSILAREPAIFNEDDVALTFGAISDVHIGYGNNAAIFRNSLEVLSSFAENGMDAILFGGDNTQNGIQAEAEQFVSIFKEYYDPTEFPMIVTHGNHDTYWSGCMSTQGFYDVYNAAGMYTFDLDMEAAKLGNRHVVVNGYHFITVQIQTYMPGINNLSSTTSAWLKSTLNAIVKEDAYAPIFLTCHSPAMDTVYGSDGDTEIGNWGASEELKAILDNYPQVIGFFGHTHYFNNDERNIMQTGFTAINCGGAADADNEEDTVETSSGVPNARSYSQGMLVEVDGDGNVRVTRIDFARKKQIKNVWIIPSPKADGSHLTYYSPYRAALENEAPVFADGASVDMIALSDSSVKVTFTAAMDDDMVYSYNVSLLAQNGTIIASVNTISPWMNYPDLALLPKTHSYTFTGVNVRYPCTVRIIAKDSWGAVSEALSVVCEDPTEREIAQAAAFDERLESIGEITAQSFGLLSELRNEYCGMSYSCQARVTRLDLLIEAERVFYNSFVVFEDVSEHEVDLSETFNTIPSSTRGKVEDSQNAGIKITWSGAAQNNTVGVNKALDLNGLHAIISDIELTSDSKSVGFIISSTAKDKHTGTDALLVYINFNNGSVNVARGNSTTQVGVSESLLYNNVIIRPIEILFTLENDEWFIIVTPYEGETVKCNVTSAIGIASSITDTNSVYFGITPWALNTKGTLTLRSVHSGPCVGEEVQPQQKPTSGCRGSAVSATVMALMLLSAAFVMFKRKRV